MAALCNPFNPLAELLSGMDLTALDFGPPRLAILAAKVRHRQDPAVCQVDSSRQFVANAACEQCHMRIQILRCSTQCRTDTEARLATQGVPSPFVAVVTAVCISGAFCCRISST